MQYLDEIPDRTTLSKSTYDPGIKSDSKLSRLPACLTRLEIDGSPPVDPALTPPYVDHRDVGRDGWRVLLFIAARV